MEIRTLERGDERRLEAFLKPRTDSSMLLRGNVHDAGLVDRGQRHQGTYAAAFEGKRITGVVAHYWNGNLVPQAPCERLPALVRWVLASSDRDVLGAVGPADQVTTVLDAAGLSRKRKRLDTREGLYRLELDDLRLPSSLNAQRLQVRYVQPEDRDPLVAWFDAYEIETLGQQKSARLTAQSEQRLERSCGGPACVLLRDGEPVSFSGFNAVVPDAVQLGGVYTPPAERGKGFARAVVAGSLDLARRRGVKRAVLFTDDDNVAAIHAYSALGFQRVGDFRLALLAGA